MDILKELMKTDNFLRSGRFIFSKNSSDIMSGYCIEQTPSFTNIWTYILPMYEKINFLHFSLGDEIKSIPRSSSNAELINLSNFVNDEFNKNNLPRTAEDLLLYIDTNQRNNPYSIWCRYISLIRLSKFGEARDAEEEVRKLAQPPGPFAPKTAFEEIQHTKENSGWPGVQILLDQWVKTNHKTFYN